MNWLNTPTSIIHAPEYVGSEPTQRATWWNLLVYCATQENGGIVRNCRHWKCRRWQQTCGVTADEVNDECDLWLFDGDDLLLWGYPNEKEIEVKAMREGGAKGGKAKALKASNPSPPTSPPTSPPSTEEKRREDKEEKGSKATACASGGGEPAPIPFPNFPDDNQTTTTKNHMEELASKVRGLREGWKLPLTYAEMQTLAGCSAALESLTDAEWQTMRDYLHAKLPEGSAGWQPRGRAKFLESVSDVYSHATQWARKSRVVPRKAPVAEPTQVRTAEDEEAMAAFLRDGFRVKS